MIGKIDEIPQPCKLRVGSSNLPASATPPLNLKYLPLYEVCSILRTSPKLTQNYADSDQLLTKVLLVFFLAVACLRGGSYTTGDVFVPSDARTFNVRSYGAAGDGVTDDTQAIRAAIRASATNSYVYFPNGTYLISGALPLYAYHSLQGQNQSNTVIKLKDGVWPIVGACATGAPPNCVNQSVIYTYSANSPWDGDGNEAYNIFINDLTIDVGSGNYGAEGVHWIGNNSSAINNVTIRTEDYGYIGLDMRTQYFGPALIKNLTVGGFQYGIAIDNRFSSVTGEHITLINQGNYAVWNKSNTLSLYDLETWENVPVLLNQDNSNGDHAASVIINGNFNGYNGGGGDAVHGPGQVYLQNISWSGYTSLYQGNQGNGAVSNGSLPNGQVSEANGFADAPEITDSNPGDWVNVEWYGAVSSPYVDNTPAVQAAINSGAYYIYFPQGNYGLGSELDTTGSNVCAIRGWGTTLTLVGSAHRAINFGNTNCGSTVFQGFTNGGGFTGPELEGNSTGNVAIRDLRLFGYQTNGCPGGKVFVEDVSFGPFYFTCQNAWGYQMNTETSTKVGCYWCTLTVLGLKTEEPGTVLNIYSGNVAVYGAYIGTQQGPPGGPMIYNNCGNVTFFGNGDWNIWTPVFRNDCNGITDINSTIFPWHGQSPATWNLIYNNY